jgi:hypothetical protein
MPAYQAQGPEFKPQYCKKRERKKGGMEGEREGRGEGVREGEKKGKNEYDLPPGKWHG